MLRVWGRSFVPAEPKHREQGQHIKNSVLCGCVRHRYQHLEPGNGAPPPATHLSKLRIIHHKRSVRDLVQVVHVSLMHLLLFWAVVSCPGSGAVGTHPCIHAAEGQRVLMSNFLLMNLCRTCPWACMARLQSKTEDTSILLVAAPRLHTLSPPLTTVSHCECAQRPKPPHASALI